jgi:hypothetical protein
MRYIRNRPLLVLTAGVFLTTAGLGTSVYAAKEDRMARRQARQENRQERREMRKENREERREMRKEHRQESRAARPEKQAG